MLYSMSSAATERDLGKLNDGTAVHCDGIQKLLRISVLYALGGLDTEIKSSSHWVQSCIEANKCSTSQEIYNIL